MNANAAPVAAPMLAAVLLLPTVYGDGNSAPLPAQTNPRFGTVASVPAPCQIDGYEWPAGSTGGATERMGPTV